MKVKLLSHTPDPEKLVAAAAKNCYSASNVDNILEGLTEEKAESFVNMLSEIGHESPIEHVSFTFAIEGVSRSLLAQITRHRMASFSVQSQRYVREKGFEYVVPPLEGFWWQDDVEGVDYTNKSAFNWISVIRLPDFISKADFDWAVETATKKKKLDCSSAEYLTIDEGLCVQIMHIGSFDNEPATVALMDTYIEQNGYVNDINKDRLHHEIYMSDARKVAPEKWKTVIRHPIKKA